MTPPAPVDTGLLPRAALLSALGAGLATGVAVALQPVLGLGDAYAARVGLVALGTLAVACVGIRRHHAFRGIGPANLVTGTRVLLVALLAGVAVDAGSASGASAARAGWLVGMATVAASLDLVDGWLARRTRMASDFGARFDMETDALLILVLSLLVWRAGLAGPWVMASGLMRYGFVAAAVVLPWMGRALPPSRRRQTICVVQIAALIVALAPFTPPPAALGLAASSLLLLSWSFGVDVAWLVARRP